MALALKSYHSRIASRTASRSLIVSDGEAINTLSTHAVNICSSAFFQNREEGLAVARSLPHTSERISGSRPALDIEHMFVYLPSMARYTERELACLRAGTANGRTRDSIWHDPLDRDALESLRQLGLVEFTTGTNAEGKRLALYPLQLTHLGFRELRRQQAV